MQRFDSFSATRVRVPDFTSQKAFSCPTAHVRLVGTRRAALAPAAAATYFEAHRNVANALGEVGLRAPRPVRSVALVRAQPGAVLDRVPEMPDQRGDGQPGWKCLAGAAAYALDTLKYDGHLRPRDVPRFTERVIALDPDAKPQPGQFSDEWVENIVVHIAGLLPRYAKCNDGTRALAALKRIEADRSLCEVLGRGGLAAERGALEALGIVQRESDRAAQQHRDIYTRRAVATPTRILPMLPSLDASNRILRQYAPLLLPLLDPAHTCAEVHLSAPHRVHNS